MSVESTLSVLGAIGSLTVSISALVYVKRSLSTDKIIEKFDELLSEISSNTDMQKKLYVVGGVLGQGIKAGIGLQGKASGKFGMNDIIGALLARFLGGNLLSGGNGQQPQQTQGNEFESILKGGQ